MDHQLSEFQRQTYAEYERLTAELDASFQPDSFELQDAMRPYEDKLFHLQAQCDHVWTKMPTLSIKQCALCSKIEPLEDKV